MRQSTMHLIIGNRNYSSWSLRAWLGLTEAGLNFRETLLPLDTAEFRSRIGSLSPSNRVPVLRVGDAVIWDSLSILEFAAEQSKSGPMWPEDRFVRAHARSISAEMHSGFFTLRERLPMNIRRRPAAVAVDADLQSDIDRIEAIWTECRRNFGQSGPYLFGRFTMADAMYAPVVLRFPSYDMTLGKESEAYMAAIRDRPSVQRWCSAAREEHWIVDVDEV